jgi:hypothetical protein
VGVIDGSIQQQQQAQQVRQYFIVTAGQQQLQQGGSQWRRLKAGLVGLRMFRMR